VRTKSSRKGCSKLERTESACKWAFGTATTCGELRPAETGRWLAELARVLERPKISRYLEPGDAKELLNALRLQAEPADDPPAQPGVTPDPGDDYLASLARAAGADYLVSGDAHLTGLEDAEPPVLTPREFDELFGPVD